VQGVLLRLGFHLTLFVPADVPTPSSSVPALPAQFHAADEWETEIISLAGRDPNVFMQHDQDERDGDNDVPGRMLPTHASRRCAYPGANLQRFQRVVHIRGVRWKLAWETLLPEKERFS
jgi:hypothetical protein